MTPRKGESREQYLQRERENWRRRTKAFRSEQLAESTTRDAPLPAPAVEIPVINVPENGLTVALVLDAQVKHGVPIDHLRAYGRYIAAHRPDVVLCIGDFADMRSLNRHDLPGSKKREGQRYWKDIEATRRGMDALMVPIVRESGYDPMRIMLYGNHEDLIPRYVDANPVMDETLSLDNLGYADYGWKCVPFLQPIVIGGVAFCHYFPAGIMGRPITRADQLLTQMGMSCVAGHQQGRQIAWARRADGGERCAIISGSFYQHDEDYMSPLANRHWRGTYFLHEVKDGSFAEMALTVNYLLRKWK